MIVVFITPMGKKKPIELSCTLADNEFNLLVAANGLPDWNQHYKYIGHFPNAHTTPIQMGEYAIAGKP